MAEGTKCDNVMRALDLDVFALLETKRYWDGRSKYLLSKIMRRDGPGAAIAASDFSEKDGYLP